MVSARRAAQAHAGALMKAIPQIDICRDIGYGSGHFATPFAACNDRGSGIVRQFAAKPYSDASLAVLKSPSDQASFKSRPNCWPVPGFLNVGAG